MGTKQDGVSIAQDLLRLLGGVASRVKAVDRNGYSPLLTNAAAVNSMIGGTGRNEWRSGDGRARLGQSGLWSANSLLAVLLTGLVHTKSWLYWFRTMFSAAPLIFHERESTLSQWDGTQYLQLWN